MFAGAGPIIQSAWVVRDFDESLAVWIARGAGPFMVGRRMMIPLAYRGEPVELELSVAWGQFDGMQIELIEQLEEGPSMFRELVPPGQSRIHHMSTYTDNFTGDLAHYRAQGAEVVFSGLMKGAPVCWLDTVATLGFMTELITANPEKEKVFAMFREAAENWDGIDPIRVIS